VVSACAALLYEAAPLSTPDDIATALRTSSVMVTDDTNTLSFPRLDYNAAHDALIPPAVPVGSIAMRLVLALLLAATGGCLAVRPRPGI